MLLILETITWKPHIETAIEIALRRRELGQQVLYCNLRRGLPICEDQSAWHGLIDLPEVRIGRAAELLAGQGIRFERAAYSADEQAAARRAVARLLASCSDIDDVKRVSADGFHDLGWAALSSVITRVRDPDTSWRRHRRLIRRYCEAALLVFEKSRQLIDRHRPDEVLLFNGRFATTRAVMRAAERCGVRWTIHERGGSRERFLETDFLPHDIDRTQEAMESQWSPSHAQIGHGYFHARRNRIERSWHSFALGQQPGLIPEPMRASGDWITFFTSSEDELAAIGDQMGNPAYPSQIDAIRAVAEAVERIGGLQLCVRVHPHIAQKSPEERRRWEDLSPIECLLLGPSDPADSYALIERSRVVCSYGSTVGVEATYWGRPSLLFSRTFYDRIGVCEIARDAAQVEAFLRSPVARPQSAALKYGAFWEQRGTPYRFYAPDSLHRGRICGVYLDDAPRVVLARRAIGRARSAIALRR